MKIKDGAVIAGLDIRMRPAKMAAERIWKKYGRAEGVTITSGLDGVHSAGSLHPYGLALDFRTRYFNADEIRSVYAELKESLPHPYDVILHDTHIHVEYDPFK